MKNKLRKSNAGMALLTALMFISITVIVLTAMTARYVQQRLQTDHFEDYYNCFEVAEGAVQQGKAAIESFDFDFRIGIPDTWTPTFSDGGEIQLPDFDGDGIVPATFNLIPGSEYILYTHDWAADGRDTNGDGLDDTSVPNLENGFFSIHVIARLNGVTRQLEAIYSAQDINVWRNAVFAGTGAAGGLINGNVSVAGSVHLLGEGLPTGGLAVSALDMSGTSLIHNNYDGIPALMLPRVPALKPTVLDDGRTVPTLEAELRCKNGLVSLSGNSMVGEPADGTAVKRKMDGVFVNDGWSGNSTIAGVPTMVHSDNGFEEKYDLGNKVSFPLLSDYWREPDGSFVNNPNTGDWYTHEEYFSEVLVGDPNIRNDGFYKGNISLDTYDKSGKEGFYFNANTGETIKGPGSTAAVAAIVPNPAHDYILFNPANNTLKINGNIRIEGSFEITGKGNDTTVFYSGRGAILTTGASIIDTNLYTQEVGPNAFPVNSCFGIMSKGPMSVGTGSQLNIMGAFYSEQSISTIKQTNIMGTFVSNFFDMGTNVPSIFQVPALPNNLPLGMIGNYPILNMRCESWREIGI
jgi:hypothetical protein